MRGSEGLRMRYPNLYQEMMRGSAGEIATESGGQRDVMGMFEMIPSVPVAIPGQKDGWAAEPGSAK